ncbi:MAG: hypothetical protein V4613_09510 [Bacteroidota bacterium]
MKNQLLIRTVLFFVFGMTWFQGQSQINLEFTTVNEYSFNTREALNLIITNGHTKAFNVYVKGHIKDGNGQMVVEFKSTEVVLNTGANVFTQINISLAETQYFNNDIAEIEQATGSYPSGNYSICLWTVCSTSDCNGIGSDAGSMEPKCLYIHIENPTPLLLATPENEAEIETTRPLYTWIPPSPVAGSANLNYKMILVEILEGQSKADALMQNRPILEMDGILNPALMHPSDLPELEKGKWYAWQVEAYVGKTSIAKSEQWKFKIKKEEKKVIARYFLINKEFTDIPKISIDDQLFFIIDNQVINSEPKFTIRVLKGGLIDCPVERVVKDSTSIEFDQYEKNLVQGGLVKYHLYIDPKLFSNGLIYELVTILPNNKKYIFRFEII